MMRLSACLAALAVLWLPLAALEFNSPTLNGAANMQASGSYDQGYDNMKSGAGVGAAVAQGSGGRISYGLRAAGNSDVKPGQDQNSGGPSGKESTPEKSGDSNRFWIALGMFSGACVGGYLGSLAGPVGGAVGAILGAVIGGIIAMDASS